MPETAASGALEEGHPARSRAFGEGSVDVTDKPSSERASVSSADYKHTAIRWSVALIKVVDL
jgi:hypothetical protein